MIETKQCSTCGESPPYGECYAASGDTMCARTVAYENAKLPAYPLVYCDEWVTKEDYDKLRVYASRLAVDLSLLNGIITRAARDAQKYVDAAERSLA